jgi:hypothetical protein
LASAGVVVLSLHVGSWQEYIKGPRVSLSTQFNGILVITEKEDSFGKTTEQQNSSCRNGSKTSSFKLLRGW